ncbi:YicC family protein [Verrucomicrobiaceae bacterium N1E253]|uniref:YicC family protein n=2 Tax=Oceaniferula marina TaxID=2748318 RepID=A0A851GPK7_9BACT|nr:YicC family protein [Oceaniferula marina]
MHSMTGFGRAEYATTKLAARVEAASVNRKQGEIVVQMPRIYAELEASIRKLALNKLSRGRVTLNIQVEAPETASGAIQINSSRAKALEAAFTELSDILDRPIQPDASDFIKAPDIFDFDDQPIDPEEAWAAISPAVEEALDQLIAMRADEGRHLMTDIEQRICILENLSSEITIHAPAVIKKYKENLHRRLAETELEFDLNDERILKEIGLFADRCDISEEITRLQSHFEKFRQYLNSNEPVGRPLDFLCQELNREFNTIGSKANDATLAQLVVNAKTELEKIREQVQNIE